MGVCDGNLSSARSRSGLGADDMLVATTKQDCRDWSGPRPRPWSRSGDCSLTPIGVRRSALIAVAAFRAEQRPLGIVPGGRRSGNAVAGGHRGAGAPSSLCEAVVLPTPTRSDYQTAPMVCSRTAVPLSLSAVWRSDGFRSWRSHVALLLDGRAGPSRRI